MNTSVKKVRKHRELFSGLDTSLVRSITVKYIYALSNAEKYVLRQGLRQYRYHIGSVIHRFVYISLNRLIYILEKCFERNLWKLVRPKFVDICNCIGRTICKYSA